MTPPRPTPDPAAASTDCARQSGAAITVTDLVRRYGTGSAAVTALDGITLAIEPRATIALVGRSGSGKSTVLHLLGAMDTPTSGQINVNDQHVETFNRAEAARYRRTVGFVFQRFHLLGALSALDNVLAPTLPFRHRANQRARALNLLERVGLERRSDALPSELSGGQQQRVAIARALINQPRLLLADEPTGNLDTATGNEILDLLFDLREEHGTTIIIATHDPAVAVRCDRAVRLIDGRVAQSIDGADRERVGKKF